MRGKTARQGDIAEKNVPSMHISSFSAGRHCFLYVVLTSRTPFQIKKKQKSKNWHRNNPWFPAARIENFAQKILIFQDLIKINEKVFLRKNTIEIFWIWQKNKCFKSKIQSRSVSYHFTLKPCWTAGSRLNLGCLQKPQLRDRDWILDFKVSYFAHF